MKDPSLTNPRPLQKNHSIRQATTHTRRISWTAAVGIVLILAFVAQGSRGLWEPDEGFYANVALHMTDDGDWWVPRLNGEPFLDKPPLHYWGMAAGLSAFGSGTWPLRAANALWFAATALVLGALAGRLWGSSHGPTTSLTYATMLAPFVAGNVLTPDTALTFCVTASAYAYWRWHTANQPLDRWTWSILLGLAGGLGILAKGPAMLIFVAPLGLHQLMSHGLRTLKRADLWMACGMASLVGGSWYLSMALLVPDALGYLFDNQVAGRLWSGHYLRNAGWTGPLKVYGPMILAGSLPWSIAFGRALRRGWRGLRTKRWVAIRDHQAEALVALWIVAPLIVLCLAQSRLPFYALPLMPAIALAAGRGVPAMRRQGALPVTGAVLTSWLVFLVAVKATAAWLPADRDSRQLAMALDRLGIARATKVVAVDAKRSGLPLYGFRNLEWVRFQNRPYPYFAPPASLAESIERDHRSHEALFVARRDRVPDLLDVLNRAVGSCVIVSWVQKSAIVGCDDGTPGTQPGAPLVVTDLDDAPVEALDPQADR